MDSSDNTLIEQGLLSASDSEWDCARFRTEVIAPLAQLKVVSWEPPEYLDHPLKGRWNHHRDSHIEPDCLSINLLVMMYILSERDHMQIFSNKPFV